MATFTFRRVRVLRVEEISDSFTVEAEDMDEALELACEVDSDSLEFRRVDADVMNVEDEPQTAV